MAQFVDRRGVELEEGDVVLVQMPEIEAVVTRISHIPKSHPEFPQGVIEMELTPVVIPVAAPYPRGGVRNILKVIPTEEQKADKAAKERAKPSLIKQ